MVLIGVIRFEGYREWTESLGCDREWYIQLVQAKTYSVIQSFAADHDGQALPLRYDIQVILLPPDQDPDLVGLRDNLLNILRPYSPTPVRVAFFCGPVPDALERVKLDEELSGSKGCDPSPLAVAHADVNHFTKATYNNGPYLPYVEILKLVSHYAERLKTKALIQYLGGDNIAALADPKDIQDVVDELTRVDGVKVGVGISKSPRKAFSLAAKALTTIREGGRIQKYLILQEEGM
jgi:GTP cyclohydrolase IIa